MFEPSSLRPVLRSIAAWQLEPDGLKPGAFYVTDELCYTLSVSRAGASIPISADELQTHGLAIPAAFDIAFRNLHLASAGTYEQILPGVFLSPWRDGFDAARIAIVEVVPAGEDVVIMIPDPNHLFFAKADDPDAIDAMVGAAGAAYDADASQTYRLQMQPLVRRDGALVPFDPAGFSGMRIRESVQMARAFWYDRQERHFTQPGKTMFQRVFLTRPEAQPEIRSTTVWPFGCEAMLPKADDVFFSADGVAVTVPWDAAAAIMHLEALPGLVPLRFRITGVVSAEQRAALKVAATRVEALV